MDLHNTVFTLAEVIEALVGYLGKCDHANRLESHVLLCTSVLHNSCLSCACMCDATMACFTS